MVWSTRLSCLLACAVTYALAALRLGPLGLFMGILPAIVVGFATKRVIEKTAIIDGVIAELVRRGGGDF